MEGVKPGLIKVLDLLW